MSKKKNHLSKKTAAKVSAAAKKQAPKKSTRKKPASVGKKTVARKPRKAPKKYERHHTQEMNLLEKKMPGAVDVVEKAKESMDKAIRNAKRTAAYRRGKKWETEATVMTPEEMAEYRGSRIWVPKRVLRRKELEERAAFFEKDPKGKTRLQSGLDAIARMGALADRWANGGYVTYAQIEFMANKLGIDMNVMLDYDLFQMSNAIHETFETSLSKEERQEFGYVEIGRNK